jgi:SpoVK/Ycf46/Vps4 family AAA+-type ATPase
MRLDFATLYNKFFGETERNLREALKAAEGMAPCVLWVDEIEKGLATDHGSGVDGGVSRRVLGTLLTWLAERNTRVFIVATANDIQGLPPELLRKGRFDEIFFVDLPDAETRKDIFRIHLKRRRLDPALFNLDALAEHAEEFSGAEIEQAIVSALYEAYAKSTPLTTQIILAEMQRTRPLSVVMAERVAALRAWAKDRAVRAD